MLITRSLYRGAFPMKGSSKKQDATKGFVSVMIMGDWNYVHVLVRLFWRESIGAAKVCCGMILKFLHPHTAGTSLVLILAMHCFILVCRYIYSLREKQEPLQVCSTLYH
jgi:hypothetical protein